MTEQGAANWASLDRRLTTVEERLDVETGLNASRDRDLADMQVTLRSHTAMLQAVQERLADHSRRFDAMDRRFDAMDRRFDAMDGRFDAMDGRIDRVEGILVQQSTGIQTIVMMLNRLIDAEPDGSGS